MIFFDILEKVYFGSQILERPSIGEYWNISSVPVLPKNVIFTFFRTCWCYLEAHNTGMQKWSSIVQYSCTSIWDLKYTFSDTFILSRRFRVFHFVLNSRDFSVFSILWKTCHSILHLTKVKLIGHFINDM